MDMWDLRMTVEAIARVLADRAMGSVALKPDRITRWHPYARRKRIIWSDIPKDPHWGIYDNFGPPPQGLMPDSDYDFEPNIIWEP